MKDIEAKPIKGHVYLMFAERDLKLRQKSDPDNPVGWQSSLGKRKARDQDKFMIRKETHVPKETKFGRRDEM